MTVPGRAKCKGFGVLALLLGIPLAITLLAVSVFAYYESRKAYWDWKIETLCEQEGAVRILDRVQVTSSDVDVLGRNDGHIAIPIRELAHRNAPVYAERAITNLSESNPRVWREEITVIRANSRKAVASWVSYSRVGGDFPTYGHPTQFGCPDPRQINLDLQKLFILKGESK